MCLTCRTCCRLPWLWDERQENTFTFALIGPGLDPDVQTRGMKTWRSERKRVRNRKRDRKGRGVASCFHSHSRKTTFRFRLRTSWLLRQPTLLCTVNAATQSVARRFPRDQSALSSPSAAPPGGGGGGGGDGPGLAPEEAWPRPHPLGPRPPGWPSNPDWPPSS